MTSVVYNAINRNIYTYVNTVDSVGNLTPQFAMGTLPAVELVVGDSEANRGDIIIIAIDGLDPVNGQNQPPLTLKPIQRITNLYIGSWTYIIEGNEHQIYATMYVTFNPVQTKVQSLYLHIASPRPIGTMNVVDNTTVDLTIAVHPLASAIVVQGPSVNQTVAPGAVLFISLNPSNIFTLSNGRSTITLPTWTVMAFAPYIPMPSPDMSFTVTPQFYNNPTYFHLALLVTASGAESTRVTAPKLPLLTTPQIGLVGGISAVAVAFIVAFAVVMTRRR